MYMLTVLPLPSLISRRATSRGAVGFDASTAWSGDEKVRAERRQMKGALARCGCQEPGDLSARPWVFSGNREGVAFS